MGRHLLTRVSAAVTGWRIRLRSRQAARTRAANRRARQARAELAVERRLLQMFQKAMLPDRLPVVPGVELAATYLPRAERLDIGGDWYDAFPLTDGRLALVVGDVAGHDLRAAVVMGQVRNAVRAYAIEDPRPGEVMRRSNRLLTTMADLDLVTMLFGVYDPMAHVVAWSRAGHPPPLLRPAADPAATRVLESPAGVLLGVVDDGSPYPEGEVALAPGDTVLWFTDGLVERRDRVGTAPASDPEAPFSRLCTLVASAAGAGGVTALVGRVATGMCAGVPQEDDVCLLALQRQDWAAPERDDSPPPRADVPAAGVPADRGTSTIPTDAEKPNSVMDLRNR